ncbi:hypothetical protein KAFR_0F00360 [Kazachstania africana CBS 2517]|uniref:COP9 signalosome complex subunit 5 n=1 Tax=Kazachstania africana (strain ATCC 22294 / BCRC 22015 / CBS 2517 / CECT 1963 / NBRC 1671 / NRRL Y-8276) TaxID=1071382 RepID=H2AW83_KAZAF|nr:hypothetical protein KAFR_0F00360 [Kazachstania africana CBS 2517]CCF58633.1 hypothetical protein KAFR_0F00360 [Kazachstania africana CBS 2517]
MSLPTKSVAELNRFLKEEYIQEQRENEFFDHINGLRTTKSILRPSLSASASTDDLSENVPLIFDPNQDEIIRECNNYKQNEREKLEVDAQYYDSVLISKLACEQILNHSIEGNRIEVMGMLLGMTVASQFIIFDSFKLPVQGTETRVNAQSESYEYMVQYVSEFAQKNNNIVGWYHSHPDYNCWLSNIDMTTQDLNQSYQDPYLAIVVDPIKSLKEKKICMGAFRTIKENDVLQSYQLPLYVFDSALNKLVDETTLNLKISNINLNGEYLLLKNLLDNMKQVSNYNELVEEDVQNLRSRTSERNNKFRIYDSPRENPRNKDASAHIPLLDRGHRNKSTSSLLHLMSSGNEESDIDMERDSSSGIEFDLGSASSSLYTVMDAPGPTTTSSLSHFPQLPVQNTRRTDVAQRDLENNLLSGTERSNMESETHVIDYEKHSLKNNHSGTINNVTMALQKGQLRSNYISSKQALFRLKIEEYKKLRFYKDAFTL